VGATLGALALAPSVAGAQGVATRSCPSPVSHLAGATCGTLPVPLDHLGRVAGVQTLAFARIPARGTSRGTIAVVPGGPGQPALGLADGIADALRPVLADHDLLLVDPRGTGLSDATGCTFEGPGPTSPRGRADIAACAARLGPRIGTLTSEQDADDLDAVRATLGIPTLTVVGVSSGTRVAAEYVRRFPASTDHLVLDSPVSFDGVDALGTLPTLSFPRVLREVCWPPGCAGISQGADPRATVGRLVARLSRRALRTAIADARGTPRRLSVTLEEAYVLLRVADADPFLRADLPAAIRSAIDGDGAYLARELILAASGTAADEVRAAQARAPSDVDDGRFLATMCVEARLPWRPDAPVAGRDAALAAQLQALAPQLAPFPTPLVASFSVEPACALWPPVPLPSLVNRAAPAVPTLILSGREDLRTPVEDARREAASYPNVRLLTVPDVGHSVLTTDLSSCSSRGLAAFLANGPVANCTRRPRVIDPAPFIPAHIGSLRPPPFLGGLPGRTVTAFGATLFDATRQTERVIFGAPPVLGGLRRGTVRFTPPGRITLRGYETVAGVRVTGVLSSSRQLRARFTISGPSAAAGTLTLRGDRITGTLGGRRISVGGGNAAFAAFVR
jgi:pimeloyl-ACP methyl ester carboxylesterase